MLWPNFNTFGSRILSQSILFSSWVYLEDNFWRLDSSLGFDERTDWPFACFRRVICPFLLRRPVCSFQWRVIPTSTFPHFYKWSLFDVFNGYTLDYPPKNQALIDIFSLIPNLGISQLPSCGVGLHPIGCPNYDYWLVYPRASYSFRCV